jgi:hypothetical protein
MAFFTPKQEDQAYEHFTKHIQNKKCPVCEAQRWLLYNIIAPRVFDPAQLHTPITDPNTVVEITPILTAVCEGCWHIVPFLAQMIMSDLDPKQRSPSREGPKGEPNEPA